MPGHNRDVVELSDLVDLAEAAEALGIDPETFRKWQQRYDVPAPVKRVGAAGIWLLSELRAWRDGGGGPHVAPGTAVAELPSAGGGTSARAFTAYWIEGDDPGRSGVRPDRLWDTRLDARGVSRGAIIYPLTVVDGDVYLVTRAVVASDPRRRGHALEVTLDNAAPQRQRKVPTAALRQLQLFRVSEACPRCGRRGQCKVAVGERYRFERCDLCEGHGCLVKPPVLRAGGRVDPQTFRQLSEIAHGTERVFDNLVAQAAA